MTRSSFLWMLALLASGCASQRLAGADLDAVSRPAFISRIENEAGPHSHVFREDATYKDKLKKLEPKEADRRLEAKLVSAVTRFEISERLRGNTFRQLPRERPWVDAVDPARVASVLESFLVQEVPANAPDYDLLIPLRADSVVEFVIEDYGMRSEKGRAGAYLKGHARMFRLKGGSELWRHPFSLDRVSEGAEHLDPFKVGKDPNLFRQQLAEMLDVLAAQFAQDLSPKDRNANAPRPNTSTAGDDSVNTLGRQPTTPPKPTEPPLPPGELPDPD